MTALSLVAFAAALFAPGIISAKDTPNQNPVKKEKITVHGKAVNTKAGAAVLTPGGSLYYVEDLPTWANNILGKNVAVSGVPALRKFIPDDEVDPRTGARSQGAKGLQDVLYGVSWKVED